MTQRIIPPPPGLPAERWRAPGEEALLLEVESQIQINARRVVNGKRIAMDVDDVEEEIRMMVLIAIRRFAAKRGELPPRPFLTTVIKRRVQHFNRATRVWWRVLDEVVRKALAEQGDAESPLMLDIPDGSTAVDDSMTQEDQEEVYRALVYVLQQNLPPAAFAVLHLRIIEELSPQEIAQLTGIERSSHGVSLASKRVAYAKTIAWEMLKALGIEGWEDVLAVQPEEIDA